jgi:hypothetical protein
MTEQAAVCDRETADELMTAVSHWISGVCDAEDIRHSITSALAAARAEAREACAKAADAAALNAEMSDCYDISTSVEHRTAKAIAAAIRAGGTP